MLRGNELKNYKVLIADDSRLVVSSIIMAVRELGVSSENIFSAFTPVEVINICKANNIDFIVMDYNFNTHINGFQVFDELKQLRLINTKTIFIYITAESDVKVVNTILESKPDDYVLKPFTTPVLRNRIQSIIKKKKALMPILDCVENRDYISAIEECNQLVTSHPEYSFYIRKIKSDLLIDLKRYSEAKKEYYYTVIGLTSLAIIILFLSIILYQKLKNRFMIKGVELQLKEKQRKMLDLIIQSIPVGITIFDKNNNIINDNLCVEYNKIIDINDVKSVFNSGIPLQGEISIPDESMHNNYYRYYLGKIQVEDNPQVEFVLSVIKDVIEDRMKEIELSEANKSAQKAIQARKMFIANMSHEIRTPLTGLNGLIELLNSRLHDSKDRFLLSQLQDSSENLQMVVNDILDFSKLESGKFVLHVEKTDYLNEIGKILRVHYYSTVKKGLEFKLLIEPTSIIAINIDIHKYKQLLNNILTNAIKFTESGQITVELKLCNGSLSCSIKDTGIGMNQSQVDTIFEPFVQADAATTKLYGGTGLGLTIVKGLISIMGGVIEVHSNEGLGTIVSFTVPVEEVETADGKLYDLFISSSLDNHVLNEWIQVWHPMNGRSAATTHVEVTDNNVNVSKPHTIVIDDIPDFRALVGNTVYLKKSPFFPDLFYQELLSIHYMQPDSIDEEPQKRLNGHILIVEDNAINGNILKMQLEDVGLTSNLISNGMLALEELRINSHSYDLVISDYHMPVMDGTEMLRKIKQEPEVYGNKVVIGCTADHSPEQGHLGFDDVILKPYTIDNLIAVISKYLLINSHDKNVRLEEVKDEFWLDQFSNDEHAILMAEVFVDTICCDIQDVWENMNRNDFDGLARVLHKLKGSTGSIGFLSISKLAEKIESDCYKQSLLSSDLDEMISLLNIEVDKAKFWLSETQK
ncbi:TPA: response regulator [Vibrio parahaemolyticus]